MNKYIVPLVLAICVTGTIYGQEKLKIQTDSISPNILETIVVTGQYKPQSINRSIYRVNVISKAEIVNMAVTNVAELLKQQLNIEIENSPGMGTSKVRVLGLDSQYTKILMNNIPVAGDQSMGSSVDLSTISLDDIERVEIVKGAMGVEYGANSIGGVINIITNRQAAEKLAVRLELQEESVNSEYNLKSDKKSKGRHIQRININKLLVDRLSMGVSFSRDMFAGYWGEYKGAGTTKEVTNKRGHEWSPKTSYNGNIFLNYQADNFAIYYNTNYFHSDLTNYGHQSYEMELVDEQVWVNAAVNNDFKTTRWNHHLSVRGDIWNDASFNVDFSYQKNGLEKRRQAINLHDNTVLDKVNGIPGSMRLKATDWEKYNQSQGFYSKGSFYKPIITDKLDFNLGYELDNTKGNQGSTLYFSDVSLNGPVEKDLFTMAGYVSLEWNISDKLMLRPGFRLNYNSAVNMKTNQSITMRYKLNEKNDLRFVLGTSTRFPNYDELYMWFVDNVHDYRGNPDLKPESGISGELQWSHQRYLTPTLYLETNLGTMYQYIEDRIISAIIDGGNVLTGRNSYINENKYIAWSNELNVKLSSERMSASIGMSVIGNKGDGAANTEDYSKLLWNTQINAQFTYMFPYDIRTSLFYRYVGNQPLYTFMDAYDEKGKKLPQERILNETDPYHKFDFNIAKSFLKKKLDLTLGVKNMFNVRDINYRPVGYTGKGYPETLIPRSQRLYYGRTYFVRLTYKI